jgi:hypothetical protein
MTGMDEEQAHPSMLGALPHSPMSDRTSRDAYERATVSTTECSSSRRPIGTIDQRRTKLHRKRHPG